MLAWLFFVGVVYLFWREIELLPKRGGVNVAGGKTQTPQLVQLLTYADRLYHERKYLACEKAYLQILKLDHRNLVAYSRLGAIYAAQKNYPDAIDCLQIVVQLSPSAPYYNHLGQLYFDNRNYIKSAQAYEKALVFAPTATTYEALAKALIKISNTQKAIEAFMQAIELAPSAKLYLELAELQASARDQEAARLSYERALDLEPHNQKAQHGLKTSNSLLEKKPA